MGTVVLAAVICSICPVFGLCTSQGSDISSIAGRWGLHLNGIHSLSSLGTCMVVIDPPSGKFE